VVVPLLMGIFSVYYMPLHILEVYIFSTVLIYAMTNIFMSLFLETRLFYRPSFGSLLLYAKTFPLGIINLCFYFFGLGILLFAQFFFNESDLVVSFLALKFYVIFRGAIRVMHQAFVSQMTDARVCLSIDRISIMLGIVVLGSAVVFPDTFISLFFGDQFKGNHLFFILLALSALVFSIFNSSATRVILENRDMELMKVAVLSVIVSVVLLLIMIQFSKAVDSITWSLLGGELFFSGALAFFFFRRNEIWDRISFVLLCSLGLSIPLAVKFIFMESMLTYFISFSLMGLLLLSFSYKKLTLPVKIGA
jgi:O-antigen/teichoic acid export membrane protein